MSRAEQAVYPVLIPHAFLLHLSLLATVCLSQSGRERTCYAVQWILGTVVLKGALHNTSQWRLRELQTLILRIPCTTGEEQPECFLGKLLEIWTVPP